MPSDPGRCDRRTALALTPAGHIIPTFRHIRRVPPALSRLTLPHSRFPHAHAQTPAFGRRARPTFSVLAPHFFFTSGVRVIAGSPSDSASRRCWPVASIPRRLGVCGGNLPSTCVLTGRGCEGVGRLGNGPPLGKLAPPAVKLGQRRGLTPPCSSHPHESPHLGDPDHYARPPRRWRNSYRT